MNKVRVKDQQIRALNFSSYSINQNTHYRVLTSNTTYVRCIDLVIKFVNVFHIGFYNQKLETCFLNQTVDNNNNNDY